MTENLLQKLEEKLMLLLSEVEDLRNQIQYLKFENTSLKTEKEKFLMEKANHERKLQDILSLFDSIKLIEGTIGSANIAA